MAILAGMSEYFCRKMRGPMSDPKLSNRLKSFARFFGRPDISEEIVAYFVNRKDKLVINNTGVYISEVIHKDIKCFVEERVEKKSKFVTSDVNAVFDLMASQGAQWVMLATNFIITFKVSDSTYIVIKYNTKAGTYYELVSNTTSLDTGETRELLRLVKALKLDIWTNTEFEEITNKAWKEVKPKEVVSASLKLLVDKTLWRLSDYSKTSDPIKKILYKSSNNYSKVNEIFKLFTDHDLYSSLSISSKQFAKMPIKISIIIPAYNSATTIIKVLRSIESQKPKLNRSNHEVIVVNDGSQDDTEKIVNDYCKFSSLNIICLTISINSGRSSARNLGASIAGGEVLFFIDSDMCLASNYIYEHALRHYLVDKLVLVSLKANLFRGRWASKEFTGRDLSTPATFNDFRFEETILPSWKGLYKSVDKPILVSPITQTNYFMGFGFGKRLGIWDLACMVTTGNLSIKKKELDAIGGFDRGFVGWGFEDTFLGAKLIANGNYVVPVLATGAYHLGQEKVDKIKRYNSVDFNRNLRKYKELVSK